MKLTNYDLMRFSARFEAEFNIADFTIDELEDIFGELDEGATIEQIRDRYFEYYDDIKHHTLPKHKWSE